MFDGVQFLGFFCVFGETRLLGFENISNLQACLLRKMLSFCTTGQ